MGLPRYTTQFTRKLDLVGLPLLFAKTECPIRIPASDDTTPSNPAANDVLFGLYDYNIRYVTVQRCTTL
jgi:hypothetical protein